MKTGSCEYSLKFYSAKAKPYFPIILISTISPGIQEMTTQAEISRKYHLRSKRAPDNGQVHLVFVNQEKEEEGMLSGFRVLGTTPLLLVAAYNASAYNAGVPGSNPGLGRSSGKGNGNSPVLLPGKSHGRRSVVGYRPWGRKDSDTTE